MTTVPVDKRPDEMGIWANDGEIVWLTRELYPTRTSARQFAMREMETDFLGVRVLARYMRYAPIIAGTPEEPIWWDDWWIECEKDTEHAFPVWRLEARY